jgi:hypothetical protein
MYCKFCGKEIKNKGGLAVHENYGCVHNPNKLIRKSNWIEYNTKVSDGSIKKEYTNQFTKSKLNGINITVSKETKQKISNASKKQIWSDERRKKHSESMLYAVSKHPASYSAKNVCGRTKKIYYKGFILTGSWEYYVAEYLDKKQIDWTNEIEPFKYKWKDKIRNYFPDFYLPKHNLFLEVKGYETERDIEKWKVVPNLIVIKKDLIEQIRKGKPVDFIL